MSDDLPLPTRPNLEQYKKLAKDLVKVCKSRDRDALGAWVTEWVESLMALPPDGHRPYTPAEKVHRSRRAVDRVAEHLNAANQPSPGACTLARAQLALAREHGFVSWPKFARHLEELTRAHSPVSAFEAAVDAIVSGNMATLEELLGDNPALVRARSTREHHSTLLHYVSANGVEDFRQKTPQNIVEIATFLLNAGADVNAESEAYGGRSTTIGLAATSCHPVIAGVQLPLLELLIEHGAMIDAPGGGIAVNGCLHNGRGQAAEFLAGRGARLDLEGAAGVGRLDIVESFFNDDGTLKPHATQNQMQAGFAWACEFGRTQAVAFLLDRGMDIAAMPFGVTGLHWAAYGGHAEIARLLIERNAPVAVIDQRFNSTPLGWALHGWCYPPPEPHGAGHYEIVARLVAAGATAEANQSAELDQKLRADPRMQAALRGQMATA